MKSKRGEAIIVLFAGVLLLYFAWFVYDEYEPMNNTDSSRLQQLNALIRTIGQLPVALLFGLAGLLTCVIGVRKWKL